MNTVKQGENAAAEGTRRRAAEIEEWLKTQPPPSTDRVDARDSSSVARWIEPRYPLRPAPRRRIWRKDDIQVAVDPAGGCAACPQGVQEIHAEHCRPTRP
jgi:hypothetical protein